MYFGHKNQILWPIYITIRNLDAKTWRSQKWPETLFFGFILIIYEQFEDANNKDKDLKTKIYHMTLKTMLQRTDLGLISRKMRC